MESFVQFISKRRRFKNIPKGKMQTDGCYVNYFKKD